MTAVFEQTREPDGRFGPGDGSKSDSMEAMHADIASFEAKGADPRGYGDATPEQMAEWHTWDANMTATYGEQYTQLQEQAGIWREGFEGYKQDSPLIGEMVSSAPPTDGTLYRGMGFESEADYNAVVGSFQTGESVSLDASSFSTNPAMADIATEMHGDEGLNVTLVADGVPHDLSLEGLGPDWIVEQMYAQVEHVVAGEFTVADVSTEGTSTTVYLVPA